MVKQYVSLGRTIESKNVIYIWLTGHKGTNECYRGTHYQRLLKNPLQKADIVTILIIKCF